MLVSIGIPTYQRPQLLKQLLHSLQELQFRTMDIPEIEILVVENDPNALAKETCHQINQQSPWPIHYFVEPQRGLSYVRNAILNHRSPESDFLIFVDDDEVVEPQWLEALLQTQHKFSADVVTGPVIHVFHESTPQWIRKADLFPSTRHVTGTNLAIAFTNNVLLRTSLFKDNENRFDSRFSLSGGEDTYFFMRIYRQGHRIVWCDEAIIYDHMPHSRMTMKWLLMRNYRNYSSHTFCEKDLDLWYKVFPKRILTGSLRILLGLISLLISLPMLVFQRHLCFNALLQIARGAGLLSGLFGIQYQEYRQVHSASP